MKKSHDIIYHTIKRLEKENPNLNENHSYSNFPQPSCPNLIQKPFPIVSKTTRVLIGGIPESKQEEIVHTNESISNIQHEIQAIRIKRRSSVENRLKSQIETIQMMEQMRQEALDKAYHDQVYEKAKNFFRYQHTKDTIKKLLKHKHLQNYYRYSIIKMIFIYLKKKFNKMYKRLLFPRLLDVQSRFHHMKQAWKLWRISINKKFELTLERIKQKYLASQHWAYYQLRLSMQELKRTKTYYRYLNIKYQEKYEKKQLKLGLEQFKRFLGQKDKKIKHEANISIMINKQKRTSFDLFYQRVTFSSNIIKKCLKHHLLKDKFKSNDSSFSLQHKLVDSIGFFSLQQTKSKYLNRFRMYVSLRLEMRQKSTQYQHKLLHYQRSNPSSKTYRMCLTYWKTWRDHFVSSLTYQYRHAKELNTSNGIGKKFLLKKKIYYEQFLSRLQASYDVPQWVKKKKLNIQENSLQLFQSPDSIPILHNNLAFYLYKYKSWMIWQDRWLQSKTRRSRSKLTETQKIKLLSTFQSFKPWTEFLKRKLNNQQLLLSHSIPHYKHSRLMKTWKIWFNGYHGNKQKQKSLYSETVLPFYIYFKQRHIFLHWLRFFLSQVQNQKQLYQKGKQKWINKNIKNAWERWRSHHYHVIHNFYHLINHSKKYYYHQLVKKSMKKWLYHIHLFHAENQIIQEYRVKHQIPLYLHQTMKKWKRFYDERVENIEYEYSIEKDYYNQLQRKYLFAWRSTCTETCLMKQRLHCCIQSHYSEKYILPALQTWKQFAHNKHQHLMKLEQSNAHYLLYNCLRKAIRVWNKFKLRRCKYRKVSECFRNWYNKWLIKQVFSLTFGQLYSDYQMKIVPYNQKADNFYKSHFVHSLFASWKERVFQSKCSKKIVYKYQLSHCIRSFFVMLRNNTIAKRNKRINFSQKSLTFHKLFRLKKKWKIWRESFIPRKQSVALTSIQNHSCFEFYFKQNKQSFDILDILQKQNSYLMAKIGKSVKIPNSVINSKFSFKLLLNQLSIQIGKPLINSKNISTYLFQYYRLKHAWKLWFYIHLSSRKQVAKEAERKSCNHITQTLLSKALFHFKLLKSRHQEEKYKNHYIDEQHYFPHLKRKYLKQWVGHTSTNHLLKNELHEFHVNELKYYFNLFRCQLKVISPFELVQAPSSSKNSKKKQSKNQFYLPEIVKGGYCILWKRLTDNKYAQTTPTMLSPSKTLSTFEVSKLYSYSYQLRQLKLSDRQCEKYHLRSLLLRWKIKALKAFRDKQISKKFQQVCQLKSSLKQWKWIVMRFKQLLKFKNHSSYELIMKEEYEEEENDEELLEFKLPSFRAKMKDNSLLSKYSYYQQFHFKWCYRAWRRYHHLLKTHNNINKSHYLQYPLKHWNHLTIKKQQLNLLFDVFNRFLSQKWIQKAFYEWKETTFIEKNCDMILANYLPEKRSSLLLNQWALWKSLTKQRSLRPKMDRYHKLRQHQQVMKTWMNFLSNKYYYQQLIAKCQQYYQHNLLYQVINNLYFLRRNRIATVFNKYMSYYYIINCLKYNLQERRVRIMPKKTIANKHLLRKFVRFWYQDMKRQKKELHYLYYKRILPQLTQCAVDENHPKEFVYSPIKSSKGIIKFFPQNNSLVSPVKSNQKTKDSVTFLSPTIKHVRRVMHLRHNHIRKTRQNLYHRIGLDDFSGLSVEKPSVLSHQPNSSFKPTSSVWNDNLGLLLPPPPSAFPRAQAQPPPPPRITILSPTSSSSINAVLTPKRDSPLPSAEIEANLIHSQQIPSMKQLRAYYDYYYSNYSYYLQTQQHLFFSLLKQYRIYNKQMIIYNSYYDHVYNPKKLLYKAFYKLFSYANKSRRHYKNHLMLNEYERKMALLRAIQSWNSRFLRKKYLNSWKINYLFRFAEDLRRRSSLHRWFHWVRVRLEKRNQRQHDLLDLEITKDEEIDYEESNLPIASDNNKQCIDLNDLMELQGN